MTTERFLLVIFLSLNLSVGTFCQELSAMPIHCPIDFPRINDDEMRSIDYKVMEHVFATHNELGRLADETVYHHKLQLRLRAAGMKASIEVPIRLSFREFVLPLAMDLAVEEKVIYELKSVSALLPVHESQLLAYMFMTDSTHGKLVNFRTKSVESRFVNTTFTSTERRQFHFDTTKYAGNSSLSDLIRELIGDWGTGLSASLYRRAVLHCYATDIEVEQLLPMKSAGESIGNQRFHLLNARSALGVTTFAKTEQDNFTEFRKLISASPLSQLHWLNVTHRQVTLATIKNDRKI